MIEKKYSYEFIDIHNHVIPHLDDGANSYIESEEMLKIAYNENIKVICATPHFRAGTVKYNRDMFEYNLRRISEISKIISPDLSVIQGNEVFYNDDTVSALVSNECNCIGRSKYVLTEFAPGQDFIIIRNGLNRLLTSGFRPILAHIERYECLHRREDLVDTIIDMGVCTQVNADSLIGLRSGNWARKIIKDERVHFIATDAHNTDSRAPRMLKCAKYLSRFGDAYVKALLHDNQMKMLQNEPIL